ncbi:MAG TPA: 2-isopropylmalate synthase [Planctomycetia bacterium]|nr:2-isopropylmalate synthase [Planctomycetia bacterium]
MSAERVLIFDTTLRDGEQSPGCSMTTSEKLEVAKALADLGIDILEAGFPIASPGDFEAVRAIASEIGGPSGPVICGLARCSDADIDRAGEAIQPAAKKRVHVFLATSAIHRQFKLKMAKEEIIRRAVEGVRRAKGFTDDVEFSPEDAGRTELDFLTEVVEASIDAGATTVNIPDTVGYCIPDEYANVIAHLRKNVRNIDKAVISVHCHDDLGMAVANSMAALRQGARQVECTINGIGERAGNCSLEEIVMAIHTRRELLGLTTGINTHRLYPVSRLLSSITGQHVQRNKAIVGKNAFAHESGSHQDGMLKHRGTYEIMRPEDVGIPRTELVLGKHSGRHALRDRLSALGHELNDEQLNKVFDDFKALCDQKKEVFDADLEALASQRLRSIGAEWELVSVHATAGNAAQPSCTLVMRRQDGKEYRKAEFGGGAVDAIYHALCRITGVELKVTEYSVRSVTLGNDALGEVTIQVEYEGHSFRSRAVNIDVIMGTAQAFVNVVNRLASIQQSRGESLPALAS